MNDSLTASAFAAGPRARGLLFHYAASLNPELANATPPASVLALAHVPDDDVDPALLFRALTQAVDDAMYWEPPYSLDRVLAAPELRPALEELAARVLPSPAAAWWFRPMAHPQYQVWWEDRDPARPAAEAPPSPAVILEQDTRDGARTEQEMRRHYRWHPRREVSGAWWSTPPYQLLATSGWIEVPAGTAPAFAGDAAEPIPARPGPSGLYLVEDSLGYELARVDDFPVPDGARVYEIAVPEDFAALVARYPREVTWTQRADWGQTTGRAGRWLAVDWQRAAQDWDAVHLTAAAYLAGATCVLPVAGDAATVMAGWAPDTTRWLTAVAATQPLAQDPPPARTRWFTVEY